MVNSLLLDPNQIQTNYLFLSKVIFDHSISIMPFAESFRDHFYKISKIMFRPEDRRVRPNELYNMVIMEDTEWNYESRTCQTFVDLMEDLGGLIEIIFISVTLIMIKVNK